MITTNPMQLKAFIKKKAAEKNISAQLVMQNYMMERLLERISLSSYKHNFILKGGFLISAIVGLDTRAPIRVPLTVDVTTGDKITPGEIEYTFSLLFEQRTLSVLAYNLETVLAEKLETVLSRNIANTRPRDYYDIHILYTLRGAECKKDVIRQALEQTTSKRGSQMILTQHKEILEEIRKSPQLLKQWERYRQQYEYAKEISFEDTCDTLQKLMTDIM